MVTLNLILTQGQRSFEGQLKNFKWKLPFFTTAIERAENFTSKSTWSFVG